MFPVGTNVARGAPQGRIGHVLEYQVIIELGKRIFDRDLWMIAVSTDSTLGMIYQQSGYPGVITALNLDDRLEHWVSRVNAYIACRKTGDKGLLEQLQSCQPPGSADVLPPWALEGARYLARSEYLAAQRVRGATRLDNGADGGGGTHNQARRPRRRPRGTGAAGSAAASSSALAPQATGGGGGLPAAAGKKGNQP